MHSKSQIKRRRVSLSGLWDNPKSLEEDTGAQSSAVTHAEKHQPAGLPGATWPGGPGAGSQPPLSGYPWVWVPDGALLGRVGCPGSRPVWGEVFFSPRLSLGTAELAQPLSLTLHSGPAPPVARPPALAARPA